MTTTTTRDAEGLSGQRNSGVLFPLKHKGYLLVTACLPFLFFALSFFNYCEDDVFITMRYALNFIHGHGWVMNVGERVEGYTSPFQLWYLTFLLNVLSPNAVVVVSKFLGVLIGIYVISLCGKLAAILFPDVRWAPPVAMAALGLQSSFALSMINGLETCFATLFLTLGILEICRANVAADGKLGMRSPAYFVLAAFCRPELTLTFPLLMALRKIIHRRTAVMPATVAYCIPVAVLLVFRYCYYGDLLPNTYYAKQIPMFASVPFGLEYFLRFGLLGHSALSLALLIGGAIYAGIRSPRGAWPLLATIVVHIGFLMKSGGDWMPDGRFYAVIAPSATVVLTAGVVGVASYWNRRQSPISPEIRRIALIGMSSIFLLSILADTYKQYELLRHRPYLRGIAYVLRHHAPYSQWMCSNQDGRLRMANWISQHARSGQTVLISEMGLVPLMHMDIRFIDVCGLTDRTISHMNGYLRGCGGINGQREWMYPDGQLSRYIAARRPEWVMLVWDSNDQNNLDGSEASNRSYRPCGTFPVSLDYGRFTVATWQLRTSEGENESGGTGEPGVK